MASPDALPSIINIERSVSEYPRLVGLHITDPTPMADTLEVLGVLTSEVPEWTIYSGNPAQDVTEQPKTIVLSPREVERQMRKKAGYGNTPEQRRKYNGAFEESASEVILRTMVRNVLTETGEMPTAIRKSSIIKDVAFASGVIGTFMTLRYGLDFREEDIVDMYLGSIAGGAVLGSVASYATSEARFLRRMVREITNEKPALVTRIGRSVLPTYERM